MKGYGLTWSLKFFHEGKKDFCSQPHIFQIFGLEKAWIRTRNYQKEINWIRCHVMQI